VGGPLPRNLRYAETGTPPLGWGGPAPDALPLGGGPAPNGYNLHELCNNNIGDYKIILDT